MEEAGRSRADARALAPVLTLAVTIGTVAGGLALSFIEEFIAESRAPKRVQAVQEKRAQVRQWMGLLAEARAAGAPETVKQAEGQLRTLETELMLLERRVR